jgi:hypothetical protein
MQGFLSKINVFHVPIISQNTLKFSNNKGFVLFSEPYLGVAEQRPAIKKMNLIYSLFHLKSKNVQQCTLKKIEQKKPEPLLEVHHQQLHRDDRFACF